MRHLAALTLLCACRAEPRAPDVVLVVVDTLRADAPGFAGNPRPATPNLDALVASEAAWFSRASACASWTLPSVATLLTGRYPHGHRVVRTMVSAELWGRLDPATPTLAATFAARGYRTAAWVNNSFLAPEFGLNAGFERYDYRGADALEHRGAAETVEAALAWLNEQRDPVFLFLHLMEPHFDYNPPPETAGRFSAGLPHAVSAPFGPALQAAWMQRQSAPDAADRAYVRAVYDEEVLAADAAIGALIVGLRAAERWENATFVVTADHGEELWDQGGFEHGHTTRGAVTRVPLVVKGPGVLPGRDDTLLDHTALYPWLTAGQGRLAEAASGPRSLPGGLVLAEERLYGSPEVSVANEKLRLILNLADGHSELWRLDEDWVESEPLHAQPNRAETGAALREELIRLRGDLAATEPNDPLPIGDAEAHRALRELGYLGD